MRLKKKEMEFLFELTDKLTDRAYTIHTDWIESKETTMALWELHKKLRLELKGY